ncbi:MAG: molecular chaperone TorD family protein [Coriobacteriia bacterium]|nr:molecular chaperone TorD family protein [Coriobacteriia bacterium]
MRTNEEWQALADALAFAGNSLLEPVNQNSAIGLDAGFWREFPDLGDPEVAAAIKRCEAYASSIAGDAKDDAATRASVEYTKLFVGPPKPATPPWESAYRDGADASVGFGPAAHEMRTFLREAGLALDGPSNQYADHMGIELLYASVLCQRIAEASDEAAQEADMHAAVDFCRTHPLSWVARLELAVSEAAPDGYLIRILGLAHALLESVAADRV